MPNTQILPEIEGEDVDTPKFFTNIDTEDFSCNWNGKDYTVRPGQTVSYPKYLVNYAAMHLARKMNKREALAKFQGSDLEKQHAYIKFVDPINEMKLQALMVAKNYQTEKEEEIVEEKKVEIKEMIRVPRREIKKKEEIVLESEEKFMPEPGEEDEIIMPPNSPYMCEICKIDFKNEILLNGHKRIHAELGSSKKGRKPKS